MADQLRPKLAALRINLHSTNSLERLNGAILLEQNDEWAVQRARYMNLESIPPVGNDSLVGLPTQAA